MYYHLIHIIMLNYLYFVILLTLYYTIFTYYVLDLPVHEELRVASMSDSVWSDGCG